VLATSQKSLPLQLTEELPAVQIVSLQVDSLQEVVQSHTGNFWQQSSPKHNLPSSGPPLDSSSHPHSCFLSSRMAFSTVVGKLVPSVTCSPSFPFSFTPQWISRFSLTSPPWIFIFTLLLSTHLVHLHCSPSPSKSLSIPSFLYRSMSFSPGLAFLHPRFESGSFCFYLNLLHLKIPLFFQEVLLFKDW